MMEITEEYLEELFKEADASPRLRTNVDLRNSEHDGSQRMLNVLLPGTKVDIHRHPMSSESVMCLFGRIDEVLYGARPKDDTDARCPKAHGTQLRSLSPASYSKPRTAHTEPTKARSS